MLFPVTHPVSHPPWFISESVSLTLINGSGNVEDGGNNRDSDSKKWILQEVSLYSRTVTGCVGDLSKQRTCLIHFSFSPPCNIPLYFSLWRTALCLNWVQCLIIVNWGNNYSHWSLLHGWSRVLKLKISLQSVNLNYFRHACNESASDICMKKMSLFKTNTHSQLTFVIFLI